MELQEEITSFVDNELKDDLLCYRLKKLIEDNIEIRNEYLIQCSIKSLLTQRFSNNRAPASLLERILSGIRQGASIKP